MRADDQHASGHVLAGLAACIDDGAAVADCVEPTTQKVGVRYLHRVFGGDWAALVQRRVAGSRAMPVHGASPEPTHFDDSGALAIAITSRFASPGAFDLRWNDRFSILTTFSTPDATTPPAPW